MKFIEWYGRRPLREYHSLLPYIRKAPSAEPGLPHSEPSLELSFQSSRLMNARHQSRKRPFHSYQPLPGWVRELGNSPMGMQYQPPALQGSAMMRVLYFWSTGSSTISWSTVFFGSSQRL